MSADALLLLLLSLPGALAAPTSPGARCAQGCLPGGDASASLLSIDPSAPEVTLEWFMAEAPSGEVLLRAGDPTQTSTLPMLGALEFSEVSGAWRAQAAFSTDALRAGRWVTVLTTRRRGREQVLGWTSWRVVTPDRLAAQRVGPAPGHGWELSVTPAGLRVVRGGQPLPAGRGGDARPFWSLHDVDAYADLDLDGPSTGAPGLTVTWSAPWSGEVTPPALGPQAGGKVQFEALSWWETGPPQALQDGRVARSFHVAVTLSTAADATRLDPGGWRGPIYAHETSAALRGDDDPRAWSSYDPREHTTDPELLELLSFAEGRVPGLRAASTTSGDGGGALYELALRVDAPGAEPWEVLEVAVVASQAGYSRVELREAEDLPPALRRLLSEAASPHELDPSDLPEGWGLASPSARSLSRSGTLALQGSLSLAQRGGARPRSNVVVGAKLRAGALIRYGDRGRVVDLIPVDAHVRYVLRVTLAGPEERPLDVSQNPTLVSVDELIDAAPTPPRPQGGLGRGLSLLTLALVTAALIALAVGLGHVRAVVGQVSGLLSPSRQGARPHGGDPRRPE